MDGTSYRSDPVTRASEPRALLGYDSPMTDHDDFQLLLRRSAELHEALGAVLTDAEIDDSARALLTLSTSMIAVEHGVSICVLAEAGNLSSANVLLRSQFETLVRALWLCFAATEEWFDKYRAAAQTNPRKDPNNSPGMDDMLKAISAKAPPSIAPQLIALKAGAWGPLNSFVHGGMHPIVLQHVGFDLNTAIGTVRNANGLTVMAFATAALLTGDQRHSHAVARIQQRFMDCGPAAAC